MKLLHEENLTISQLKDTVESESLIVTQSGAPVMVILPISQHEGQSWTEEQCEQLMNIMGWWRDEIRQDLGCEQSDSRLADPGMVEVSIGLAGIATAIAAFIPGLVGIPEVVRLLVAMFSSVVAAISAYSALWLLARYCHTATPRSDDLGLTEIRALLRNPKLGPSWLLAVCSVLLFLLSIFVGALAVAR
jgi:hypothetical protein